MNPRFATIALAAVLPLSLGACSQMQDSASSAASTAASQVQADAERAAKDELSRQICQRVTDGKVSAQDKQALSGLVSRAETEGVPVEITTALRQIGDSSGQASIEAAAGLKKACDGAASQP
jgi:hypothetical protein